MKVQELRKLLSGADREKLERALVESYKNFPKSKKEEIDEMIIGILEGKDIKKGDKKETTDFGALEQEINIFVENAYAQNYFAPNRVIPKNQRPKWRFLVKNYIKEIEKIPPESEYFSRAVKLLGDLYRMLCYGCNYYIFSTEDPFRSVGWDQRDMFHMLVKKTFSVGYSKEAVSQLMLDACGGGLSREALYQRNMAAFVAELKTSDVKYMAVEVAKELVEGEERKLKAAKPYDTNTKFYIQEMINNLCGVILMVSLLLGEPEGGVKYFFANCKEATREIVLYKALDYVDYVGDDRQWMWVYEYGVKKKINPREELRRDYEKLKNELERES